MLIKDVRKSITDEQLKNIMGRMGIFPVRETETAIVYPTFCHNRIPKEGSDKLYYYKDQKIFKCYTGCEKQFDIFEMIIKVNVLRGSEDYSLPEALNFANVRVEQAVDKVAYEDLNYLTSLNKPVGIESDEIVLRDSEILKEFPYDEIGLSSWLEEGITEHAMKKFQIGYHSYLNGITIPAFDNQGFFVGARIRFLNPESNIKYMPLRHRNELLNFPTGKFLYGFSQNRDSIQRIKQVVIFEGEKSVLKFEDFFDRMNFSVATFGKRITFDHLNALVSAGIKEAIIAYDKDYRTNAEFNQKFEEYSKIGSQLKGLMNVSIIMDPQNLLDFQDSPADKGKEIFEQLYNSRTRI